MSDLPILSLTIILPLFGAMCVVLVPRVEPEIVARNARNMALFASLVTFALSLLLWIFFDTSSAEFQFVEKAAWIPGFDINYHVGVDGISLFFVLLTTFLTPLCVLASWRVITHRIKEYMAAFLVLEAAMVGVFKKHDRILVPKADVASIRRLGEIA